jgi:hypothetical protein
MAVSTVIRKPVPAIPHKVVGKAPVAKPVAKPVEGYKVVSIDSIEFLPSGRGGGKPMNPAVAKLIEKAMSLEIGQGFIVPVSLRKERPITGANGVTSTLHTYDGAQSLSKKSKANDMRFRTRRDVNNNLWLFRVEPLPQYEEVAAEEE